jgi:hypothetical protein
MIQGVSKHDAPCLKCRVVLKGTIPPTFVSEQKQKTLAVCVTYVHYLLLLFIAQPNTISRTWTTLPETAEHLLCHRTTRAQESTQDIPKFMRELLSEWE